MHAYREFIQREMDKRGWTSSDLQRASGLSKQHVSRLINDSRDHLSQRPDDATVDSLAKAFQVPSQIVLTYVAEAMGLPTSRVEVSSRTALSDDELLRILAERLREGRERGTQRDEAPGPAGSGDMEDPTQPDGIMPLNAQAAARAKWDRIRREAFEARDADTRPSDGRPRLLDDSVDEDILELPYAADDSEDPGEDDD